LPKFALATTGPPDARGHFLEAAEPRAGPTVAGDLLQVKSIRSDADYSFRCFVLLLRRLDR
jgi:hypothetical protein